MPPGDAAGEGRLSRAQGLGAHLLAVGGHEVEAAGGDGQGDGHAGELEVALAQDGVEGAAAGLAGGAQMVGMGHVLPRPPLVKTGGTARGGR